MLAKGSDLSARRDHHWTRVVVVNGSAPNPGWRKLVAPQATVVAADGGAAHALTEGVTLTRCVGDFDSLPASLLAQIVAAGVEIDRYSTAKDDTDLALSLETIRALRPPKGDDTQLLVVGGGGGRLDHALANIHAVCATAPYFEVTAIIGTAILQAAVAGNQVVLYGSPGALVSLLPIGGDAGDVCTNGLRYALDHATLSWGASRGVSNVVASAPASLTVSSGILAVIEPNGWWDLARE